MLRAFRLLCCVSGRVFAAVSKDSRALIFRVKRRKKMRPKRSFETSGTANPVTQYHITEAASLQSTGKVVMILYTKYMHITTGPSGHAV